MGNVNDFVRAVKPWYDSDGVTIYHGDCLSVMPELPIDCADMVLCDLPYGSTKNEWDTVIPLPGLWGCYGRVAKTSAAIVLFGQGRFTAELILSVPLLYRYSLVWEKDRTSGFLSSDRMPLRSHEDIAVFYAGQPTYNPQSWDGLSLHGRRAKRPRVNRNYGKYDYAEYDTKGTARKPRSVLYFPRPHPPAHPTQKPVDLAAYLIATYTNPGDLVLDNCMGSGTTLVAAKQLGRRAIGIDTELRWCELAAGRLAQGALAL